VSVDNQVDGRLSTRLSSDIPIACGAVGLVGEQQAAEVTFGSLLPGSITSKSLTTAGWWRAVIEAVDPLQQAVGGPGP